MYLVGFNLMSSFDTGRDYLQLRLNGFEITSSSSTCNCGQKFATYFSLKQHWRDSPKHNDVVQPKGFPRGDQSKASFQCSIVTNS